MKLATIRSDGATTAVRIDPDGATEIGLADVGELLVRPDWGETAAAADGPRHSIDSLDYAPLVPNPDKIICVGLNYRSHILEMGRELPEHPTIFAKYRSSLVGANDDIVLPYVSDAVDWEAELAVVIGRAVRHASPEEAESAIAGYSIVNDISMRDWQMRTLQFLQGKTFESSTPFGPWLVTPDEPGATPGADQQIECLVEGEVMQSSVTGELVFGPADLVAYLSEILTLLPGDVISTGTPGGVGAARKPPRFLQHGETVVTRIAGVGEQRNLCRREARPM